MSLLANKFTMSEDFLNRVCENLKQEPDTSSIYLSFVEDVCIAKRIEIVGCWTEDLYRIVEKSEVSMNDEAWFSIRADTFIEMRERFLKDTKPCHTFNILEDSYGVQTLNVIVEDRAEYGAPVSVLRKPYDPRDARKGINTVSIEEVTVLNVFRRNNLKYVSIDESLQELIRSVRVTARSENRSCGLTENTVLVCPLSSSAFWTNEHMAVVEQSMESKTGFLSGSVYHIPSTLLKKILDGGMTYFKVFTAEPSTMALYGVEEGRPHMWYVRGYYYDDSKTCEYTSIFKENAHETGYEVHMNKKELSALKTELQSCRRSFACRNDLKYIILKLYDKATRIDLESSNYNGEITLDIPVVKKNEKAENRHCYNTQYLLDMIKHYSKFNVSINYTEDFMVCHPEGNTRYMIQIGGMHYHEGWCDQRR